MKKDKSGHCEYEACSRSHKPCLNPAFLSLPTADYSAPLERKCTQPAPGGDPPAPIRRPGADYVDRTQDVFPPESLVTFSH